MCKNTVVHFTMEFILLITAHQFHLLFVSLVIKLDLFHHFETGKQGVTTIKQCTKCMLIFSSNIKIVYMIEVDRLIHMFWRFVRLVMHLQVWYMYLKETKLTQVTLHT